MARTVVRREPTEEEHAALERLSHARTRAARLVERARVVGARVVGAALHGERGDAMATRFPVTAATG